MISAQWLHSGMRHKTWTPYPMFYWRSNASCIETFVKLFCELNTTMPTGDRAIYQLEGLRSNPQLLLNMCWSILEEDTELELTQRHSSVWLLVKSTKKKKKKHCMNVCAIRWIRPGCSLASGLVHRDGGIYFYDELKFWIWMFPQLLNQRLYFCFRWYKSS